MKTKIPRGVFYLSMLVARPRQAANRKKRELD